MKKIIIFSLLLLPYQTILCMQQEQDDVVINFEEEDAKTEKEIDADELTNLSASDVDLEAGLSSGLSFQDFYDKKSNKINGLVLYLSTKLGIKRTQQVGNHHEAMAKYLCVIASNLEKQSERTAQEMKERKNLEEKNLKLNKKKFREDKIIALAGVVVSIVSIALSVHNAT